MTLDSQALHPFDQALELDGEADNPIARVSPAYQNMVGPFGGMTAAQLLQSVLQHPAREGTPVSLTINYLGQMGNDAVAITPTLVRTNRSNQHWLVEARQGDVVQCTATLVFAKRIDTLESEEVVCPEAPAFADVRPLPDAPMPSWVTRYDMRFVHGSLFQKQSEDKKPSESLVWIRDNPPRPLDFLSLTALCDAFFPRLFIRNKGIGIAGTVSLTIYFHVRENELAQLGDSQVLGHARASKYFGSYFDQHAEIWGVNKRLLATTTQLVYFKG